MMEEEKIKRGLAWCIKKIKCLLKRDCECQSDCNEYSTSQTVIGKWVDGRPIYRKVIFVNWDTSLGDDDFWNIASFLRVVPLGVGPIDFFTRVDARMYSNEDTITIYFGKLIYTPGPGVAAPFLSHVDAGGIGNSPNLALQKNNYITPPTAQIIKFSIIAEYVKP